MSFEITGVYQGKGPAEHINEDKEKYFFAVEVDDKYNPIKVFEVFKNKNAQAITENFQKGERVKVYFNWHCNEYKGKYFNNIQAWKIENVDSKEQDKAPEHGTTENRFK